MSEKRGRDVRFRTPPFSSEQLTKHIAFPVRSLSRANRKLMSADVTRRFDSKSRPPAFEHNGNVSTANVCQNAGEPLRLRFLK